jgi:alcohol dehydrogenase class IV
MAKIAEAMGLGLSGGETGERLGVAVSEAIYKMMREMNVKSLKALGGTREQVIGLAGAVASSHLSGYCPTPVTDETAAAVLGNVFDRYQ